MGRAPSQVFSPNLAPSDFSLFEKLKKVIKGCVFGNVKKLFREIMSEASKISREGFEAVFPEWLLRLDRCINLNGECVD
jgi:hypothetical protein